MGCIDSPGARRRATVLCAALLGSSLCAVAHADDYETELLDGVAARDRALETGEERDWRQALLHLERAVTAQPTAEAQFEFAEVAARLQLWPEAYSAYQAALALGIDGTAELHAREFLGAHAGAVALLELTGPAGAVVYVGERRRGALPLERPLAVSVGAVTVRLERPGCHPWQQHLQLSAGVHQLAAILEVDTSASSPGPGSRLNDIPEQPARWAKPTLIGGASIFLLSAAGFAATSALLPDARSDLKERCGLGFDDAGNCQGASQSRRSAAQSAADRVHTLETLRWVSVGGAALGLVGAAVGFIALRTPLEPSATACGVELQLGSGVLGMDYSGRF